MYVFGGISKKEFSSTVYSFDLEKNHWSVVTSMKPRTFFSVSVVDQHAYIYGGTNSQFHLDELSIFNLVTHSWEVARIEGKSTAKQGHCSVSHDGKVYTFGGRSEKFQFLKDLVILDTKPGTTKKEEKDLSSKIQDDITKYTTLYEAKFVPTTLQNELKEIIESDSKEEEFLKSIQNQLASWDEISTTYSMMVASRSNVQNISSSFDFDLKKIENMVASMAARKLVLSELVAKLQASMSDLKDKEQGLKTQISKKTTTKDAYDQILAKIRSNELDLNTLKGDRANYVHDEARLKERLVLLEKRKKDLQKTAEYSNAQEKEKKELQKELGEELTKIREALSKLEEEIEKYGKDIEEKSEKLDEVVKSFQKSKETKDIIDSLSKLSEQLNEKTEEFNLKMKMISSVLSIDFDQSTTTPRNQNDFIQKLNSANNKDELIKKKAQLSAEIDNLKKIIAEKNEISYSLKRKEAITKKNYDDVSSTLGHMLGENSQKTKDIEAVEKEWTDVNSQIHILKENVAETFVTEKSLIEKLKESKNQEIEKKEKFLEAQKTEFESHKNLESTQRQLESQYASLHEQLMEHIKENLDLEKLGHELEASKAVFANQRKSVENYKQMLLAKMKEVDDQRNAEMNKVVAELKKKSDELESQLKEKVSQSTEKETQLTAALSEKEAQIKQLEEKIAQLELEAKNKTVPEPTPVATETTPETPEPTPATEQIPVENQEQTKSE
jgi:chromosome segregation ATPase